MRTRHLQVGTVTTYPDAIEVNYTPIEVLGLVLSNFLIEHELAWSDGLREAWEKADRHYSNREAFVRLTAMEINDLITQNRLTVVDGDIYGFARAMEQASRAKLHGPSFTDQAAMNQEMPDSELIRMALGAKAKVSSNPEKWDVLEFDPASLERFARLIAGNTLANIDPSKLMSFQDGFEAGRVAEREECAKVCESYQDAVDRHKWPNGYECATAIRARGQK